MSQQLGWRWCRKCQSSCFEGLPGVCAGGGIHDFTGSGWYAMSTSAPAGVSSQDGWRWCHKCQVLFHPGLGAGVCPAGAGHDATGSGPYVAAISPYATGGQEGWRYCGKCHALQIGSASQGVCPAGGEHITEGSLPYSLQFGNPPGCNAPNVQQGWRRCRNCHESCYAGLPGVCASGGAHDFHGSQWYAMPTTVPSGGHSQGGWCWCSKCQVLFHPGLGAGLCPAGGGHDATGSGQYFLALTPYATGGEEGWRYCESCHALQLSSGEPGCCPGGGDHRRTGSGAYSMLLGTPTGCSVPSHQAGWRRCRKCNAGCYGGLPGRCASGGQHEFQGSAWYGMPLSAPSGGASQDGWRWCSKCQSLFHPGLGNGICPAGAGHDATGSAPYVLSLSAYAGEAEEGWRYCTKCHVLHVANLGPGMCPGGGDHAAVGSLSYFNLLAIPKVPTAPAYQLGWRRCRKCQGSCYGGLLGVCTGGGPHDFQDSAWYAMPTAALTEVSTQEGWRWCSKCQTLFHPGLGAGLCPAGGGHDATGSGAYFLASSSYSTDGQEGWRYCSKCHAVHLTSAGSGLCPGGGTHTDTGSIKYSMLLGAPTLLPEQSGWCRCRKCQGVCYVGLPGTCTAGGTHDFQGSARYVMHQAAPTEVYGQAGWRWCKKCQVLFHPGIGAGLCPSGGGHDSTGSGAYFTACTPYPAGGQEGWRYCTNCHVLHLPGTTAGVCPAGGVHLVTGSGTYSLKLEQPIETQCKLIVDYDQNQEPHSCFEVVLIPHATDGSLLPGSQVKVLSATPVNIIHQDKGVFTYQGLDSSTPLLLTTSAMGRARFTIIAPPDKMAIPNLFAQSVAMVPGQWVEFSPDDDLHTKLAGLTANQLVTAPAGKPGPLLPSSRLADAQSLAGGVSLLMGRFKPQAPAVAAKEGALSFWNPFDGDDWKDLGNDVVDAAGTVGGAIASAAQRTADVATSIANTIASQTTHVVGSVAQVLDTVGAAAQILIKNADLAIPHLVGDFVSTAMATATQLAIDVADKVTVLALVVVSGVQRIVKTVVENIEAAVQIVGAFFVRVGLTIKAVIDFLASLFDWDAILRIQSQLQDAVDERLNSIGNTIATQRASLSTQFQTLEATIAGLGEGSQVPSAQSSSGHSSSIGGQFGYLMDRLQSALGGGLSLPIDFGLDGVAAFLTSLTGTVASEVVSFLVSFASSPLCAAFADPKQLLGLGADALLALVKPLAGGAIRIVKAIADGALAVVPTLVSGLKSVIQQRISIPLLTDFIELVVFHRKQKLCLASLFTLVTAAFIHVTRKLFGSGGPLSFADDSQGSVDPLAALATVLSLVQAMLTGASVAIESESKVKLLGAVGAFLGFFGCAVTPPYSVSSASFVLPEQWLNWIFNLVASTLQLIDGVRQVNGSDSMKELGVGSATCGFLMIVFAIGFDAAAIKNGRGDAQLARLDMGAQIVSGINNTNPLLPEEAQPFLSVAGNLAAFGIGIESMKYSVAHPDASLG